MARFTGIPPVTGTIGPICIYQMYGQYYLRTRSSLTGNRVKKDPAFRKTMEYAGLLAKASRIGSAVYAAVPADRKQHSLYRKLTGEAMYWLKHEWSADDVLAFLLKCYAGQEVPQEVHEGTEVNTTCRRSIQRIKTTPSIGPPAAAYSWLYWPETAGNDRIRRHDSCLSPP